MNTKDKIQIMQAWVDGKKIEMCNFNDRNNDNKWMDCNDPDWTWGVVDYRIKPEPREWRLGFDENGAFRDCRLADEPSYRFSVGLKYIKVREVIE